MFVGLIFVVYRAYARLSTLACVDSPPDCGGLSATPETAFPPAALTDSFVSPWDEMWLGVGGPVFLRLLFFFFCGAPLGGPSSGPMFLTYDLDIYFTCVFDRGTVQGDSGRETTERTEKGGSD